MATTFQAEVDNDRSRAHEQDDLSHGIGLYNTSDEEIP